MGLVIEYIGISISEKMQPKKKYKEFSQKRGDDKLWTLQVLVIFSAVHPALFLTVGPRVNDHWKVIFPRTT